MFPGSDFGPHAVTAAAIIERVYSELSASNELAPAFAYATTRAEPGKTRTGGIEGQVRS